VLDSCRTLERAGKATVTYLPVDKYGMVDPDAVRRAITDKTVLITIMWANNEIGTIHPIAEIGKIAKEKGIVFHCDAVQAIGKVPVDVEKAGVDLASITAHKIYGPKGIGAMFVRRGTPLEPLLLGGGHERRRRAGTENVPGIVGLAKAAELAMRALEDGTIERLAALRDRLETGILRIPGTGANGAQAQTMDAAFHCHPERAQRGAQSYCHPERAQRVEGPAVTFLEDQPVPRVANTTNIWFDNLEGEALVIALDLKGVAVSGGSACHSGATEPSHVLMAMGLDKNRARASLRFSLLKTATDEDVDRVLQVVPEAVERLRELLPAVSARI